MTDTSLARFLLLESESELSLRQDRRPPDAPLADPGVRNSRTGLVKRTRIQKGWGDHRGI
jgi:hypothetical protein